MYLVIHGALLCVIFKAADESGAVALLDAYRASPTSASGVAALLGPRFELADTIEGPHVELDMGGKFPEWTGLVREAVFEGIGTEDYAALVADVKASGPAIRAKKARATTRATDKASAKASDKAAPALLRLVSAKTDEAAKVHAAKVAKDKAAKDEAGATAPGEGTEGHAGGVK